jgi:Uma2 family endonuclease
VIVRLADFIGELDLGAYGGFEGGFRLASDPDTVRAPHFWFIRKDRIPPEGLPDAFWPGAPDLAVEVLSPTDRSGDIADRSRDYFAAGVRLVWSLDPRAKAAAAFPAGRMPYFILADGELDGEDVLPGFRLPLRDVFP